MTQGLLSIVQNEKTIFKVSCGCGGFNINKFVQAITEKKLSSVIDIYYAAIEAEFGCLECLVVQAQIGQEPEIIFYNGSQGFGGSSLYSEKFHDPDFNPRWKYGTTDFKRIIAMSEILK